MKFQMHRTDFAQLIGKIQSIVPAKPSLPILANILLEADQGQLTISATDLTVSIRVIAEAKVEVSGSITLPARRLFQLVRELTSPQVEIECTSPEIAMIRSGTSEFRLQGMHKSEFPVFPDLSESLPSQFKASDLKDMMMRTSFAAAKDDSRQVLNGVLMERASQLATFIGTDGKRLARNKIEVNDGADGAYILPLKAVDEMVKLLDENDEVVKLSHMSDKLALEAGGTILITKLLSGQYPDVTRVIPEASESAVSVHREELISLLRQVSLFTSESNHSVRFIFENGSLNLSAMSGDIGEGNVNMPINYTGPKLEIAFNPQYFLDILRHSQDETVQFSVSDSYNPGLITDSSAAEFVIMPMRLDG